MKGRRIKQEILIYNATIDLITHETENCIDLRDRCLEASGWAFDREGRQNMAFREKMDSESVGS